MKGKTLATDAIVSAWICKIFCFSQALFFSLCLVSKSNKNGDQRIAGSECVSWYKEE